MILSEDISPSPSVVRICPFRGETTWSFLTRLAEAHRLKPALLLKSLGVEHSAVPRTGQTREVSLSAGAKWAIVTMCGIPHEKLTEALPTWREGERPQRKGPRHATFRIPSHLPSARCSRCVAGRQAGSKVTAYGTYFSLLCPKHRRWMLGPQSADGTVLDFQHADVSNAPEVFAAFRHYRPSRGSYSAYWRYASDSPVNCAYTAVKYWWLEHRTSDAVWRERARRLTPAGIDSELWAVAAREPITFPETIRVANIIQRYRQRLHPLRHHPNWERRLAAAETALRRDVVDALSRPWLTPAAMSRLDLLKRSYQPLFQRECTNSRHKRASEIRPTELTAVGLEPIASDAAVARMWSGYSHLHYPCGTDDVPLRPRIL
ncbi:TniQ family protein [Streptomyces iakyrus]|uniref:TniQ family protein n=1 Tax=Streptomyces iakyrus TaxID=68219 RepID=UPI0033AE8E1C